MKRLLYLLLVGMFISNHAYSQDLITPSIYLQNSKISPNGYLYPSVSIANIGKKQAYYSKVGFYISTDSILTFSDSFIGSYDIKDLYPGSFDSLSTYFTLPSSIAKGRYYLFAYADYAGQVFETNEDNNSNYVGFTVADAEADLTVTTFNAPTTAIPGDVVTGTLVGVTNSGTDYSNYNTVGYFLSKDTIKDDSDVIIGTSFFYSIYPGGTVYNYPTLYIPTNTPAGNYYILAYADYENTSIEVNENNNTFVSPLTLQGASNDLLINNFFQVATNISLGGYLQPNVGVYNNGNSYIPNVYVGYYLSKDSTFDSTDTYLTYSYFGALPSGQGANSQPTIYLPYDIPTGEYVVLAVADHNGQIEETNETNNVMAFRIQVNTAQTDLTIAALYSPDFSVAGNYLYVSGYEYNEGNTANYNGHYINYYLSADSILDNGDTYLNGEYIYSIGSGEYRSFGANIGLPSNLSSGKYYILVVADAGNSIQETNEANNVSSRVLTIVEPTVDLTAALTRSDSSRISAGTYVSTILTEYNKGTAYANNHVIGYFLSSDSIYDIGDTYLRADYTYGIYSQSTSIIYPSLFLPANVPTGTYYLIAVTDYYNELSEVDETNNIAYLKINVEESSVDLTLSFLSSDSLSTTAGTTIYPTVLNKNIGTTNAGGHYISYYLSNDNVYDSTDAQLTYQYSYGVEAQNFEYLYTSISIPSNIVPGNYYLFAVTDAFSNVIEADESNNISSLKIRINAPSIDLQPYNLNVPPSTGAGTYVSATLYEFNNGTEYAPNHHVAYYLSNDTIADASDVSLGYEYVYGFSGGNYNYLYPSLYIPSYVSKGNYYVIAVVDAYYYVNESNENNNTVFTKIKVTVNGVDLTSSALSVTNTNPSAGSFIYATSTETNEGSDNASSHFVGYFLSNDSLYDESDMYLAANYVAGLASGKSFTLHPALYLPGTVKDGVYYLVTVADYGNSNYEYDEYNNTKAIRIVVGNPVFDADLVVNYLNIYRDSINWAGSYVMLQLNESNVGTTLASQHRTSFYLSTDTIISWEDTYLGEQYVRPLSAGEMFDTTTYVQIPYNTVQGNYYILAVADDYNSVPESREYNNIGFGSLNVHSIVTGIANTHTKASNIQAYPNPTNGIVQFSNLENVEEIQVADLNNKVLMSQKVASLGDKLVDLSAFGNGVYLIKTISDGIASSSHKIVLTK